MSGRFFLSGTIPLFEGAAQPLSTFTFYLTGTTTPQDTYSDAGLGSANTNPVVTDANGYLGEVFLSRNRYKVVWKNAAGVTLKTWDPVDKDKIHTRGAGLPSDPHPGQIHDNTSDGHRYERKIGSAAWSDLGLTDTVANTASVTEQLAGTETAKYSTPDSVAALHFRGADIASASTLSLQAGGGKHFNITGTTTITGISAAVGGRTVVLKFADACQLTHNATSFIIPGEANVTTVAGDVWEFTNEAAADASGSNWKCTDVMRSSGSPINITDQLGAAADLEAASSATKAPPISLMHRHPGHPKAGANYQGSGTAALRSDYGVASLADNGTGLHTLTFDTAFSATGNYWATGWSRDDGTAGNICTGNVSGTKTTTTFQIATTNDAGAAEDSGEVGCFFGGDQ